MNQTLTTVSYALLDNQKYTPLILSDPDKEVINGMKTTIPLMAYQPVLPQLFVSNTN